MLFTKLNASKVLYRIQLSIDYLIEICLNECLSKQVSRFMIVSIAYQQSFTHAELKCIYKQIGNSRHKCKQAYSLLL